MTQPDLHTTRYSIMYTRTGYLSDVYVYKNIKYSLNTSNATLPEKQIVFWVCLHDEEWTKYICHIDVSTFDIELASLSNVSFQNLESVCFYPF